MIQGEICLWPFLRQYTQLIFDKLDYFYDSGGISWWKEKCYLRCQLG